MSTPTAWRRVLAKQAALARMTQIGAEMSTQQASRTPMGSDPEGKAAVRAMWAQGDYHRFATETIWGLGPRLVSACGIGDGQRVLDVAAGTGNVAIRAAELGAQVVACDLTPENFDAGRREAKARGVEIEWVEGDAEDLPFDDDEFDVVTSLFGGIFAPHHQRVADELLRVCRPGGRIGMYNFTPDGVGGEFFGLLGRYAPQPPGALPPLLWGDEQHVRDLFDDGVDTLKMTRYEYVERAATPQTYVDLFYDTFGPTVALRALLAGQPTGTAAFDRDFREFADRCNSGPAEGPAEYRYGYLRVIARRAIA